MFKFEDEGEKCHIIAIFDDLDQNKVKEIQKNIFHVRELKSKDDVYKLDEFEKIIKKIGIRVILIVHQRQDINNPVGSTSSLSCATKTPYEIIKVGFIDCLEYNKPNVEGIVKNNLKDVNLNFPIITGSDCHEWEAYPYHDNKTEKFDRNFTNFKCLPTFQGLLMAITSFTTRVNRRINDNNYIESISINDDVIPLSSGINAIIGDNGSGKSLFANILAKSNTESFYKTLINDNKISVNFNSPLSNNEILFIKQGEIIDDVKNGTLFHNEDLYNNITTIEKFKTQINNYANDICSYVNKNIEQNKMLDNLSKTDLTLESLNNSFYYPIINEKLIFDDENIDNNRLSEISKIISSLDEELKNNNEYYKNSEINKKIEEVLKSLNLIYELIFNTYNNKKSNNNVKKIIKDTLTDYKTSLDKKRTSFEIENVRKNEEYDNFKQTIIDYIKSKFIVNMYPKFPEKMDGQSFKTKNGYTFCKVAKFDKLDLKDAFYKFCFNKNYQDEEKLKNIRNEDDFSDALSGYDYSRLNEFKINKVNKFIENNSKEETKILESTSSSIIGHTPGELSLVYYKYKFYEDSNQWKVIIIDQPEDNINPGKIVSHLNEYLGKFRDEKQIIIVTHNPLLVVNLDVDNVIYVKKLKKEISIQSGALEFWNEKYSILNLIKNNLDGGYDAIERRLKVYGKNNN